MSSSEPLSESGIVRRLAERVCERTTRGVIATLQKMDDLLSGDDSGLRNTWDEICVQVQHEYSIFWDAYDSTVRSLIKDRVTEMADFEREAVWLRTRQGEEWDPDAGEARNIYPVYEPDIVEYLASEYVYASAADWSNARIRDYIDRTYQLD